MARKVTRFCVLCGGPNIQIFCGFILDCAGDKIGAAWCQDCYDTEVIQRGELYKRNPQGYVGMWKSHMGNSITHPADFGVSICNSCPQEKEIKCECGSESVGSPRHSTWCPKFSK